MCITQHAAQDAAAADVARGFARFRALERRESERVVLRGRRKQHRNEPFL
jgi:hypothetical protein